MHLQNVYSVKAATFIYVLIYMQRISAPSSRVVYIVSIIPCRVFALLYCLQMLALTTALCLAARPGVTDEALNYYNTPLDGFRGFVEGVVLVMLVVKIANELQKIEM